MRRQAGDRVDQHRFATRRDQRGEPQAVIGADEGDVGRDAADVGQVDGRPEAGRSRLGLQRQRDDAGIVLQTHADARVIDAGGISVVDHDRGGSQSAGVVAAGERNRDLVVGIRQIEDRQILLRLHDQQPAVAARQPQRRREREARRTAAEAVQRVRAQRGGLGRLTDVQEHQLVRVLHERLVAGRSTRT